MINNLFHPIFYRGRVLMILLFFLTLISVNSIAQIKTFKFTVGLNAGKIEQDILCDIYGDSLIIGLIPYHVKDLLLVPTFTLESDNKAYVNNIEQISNTTQNDYKNPVYYSIVSAGKEKYNYKVELVYTGLPLVYINTENAAAINSKEIYVNGQIIIYPDSASPKFSATMQIKGRGNSTWISMPKKPYKIKLSSKASILGMPEDKEWVLLANYADKSLIRNSIAFDLGKKTRLTYTPNMQHVDLIINGIYQGSYLIGEQIKVSKGRLNIKELDEDDNNEPAITGGYLLEVDERLDEEYWFKTSRDLHVTIKSPEDITPQQFDYIKEYFKATEDAINASDFNTENGYIKYINPETFIDFYWVNELFKNNDAQFYSSVYLYKNRNEKLNAGPLWDFDISAGNINYNGCDYPQGWWIRDAKWIKRLFQDPNFKSAADQRWNEMKTTIIPEMMNSIPAKKASLDKSQRVNFYKWDILNKYVWPNAVITGSYEGEIEYLTSWLEARIAWIDEQVNPTDTQPNTNFSLTTPGNNTNFFVSTLDSLNTIHFKWQKYQSGVIYKIKLDVEENGFSIPYKTILSNNYGFDTTATLSSTDIADIFEHYNINNDEKINVTWTVYAYSNAQKSKASIETYNLVLVNGVTTSPYQPTSKNIRVYPNPATDIITIETDQNFDIEQIELCDLTGQNIAFLQGASKSGTQFFNLEQYPRGTYLLCFIKKSGEKMVKRIILN
jgi:hypothetical protein